MTKLITSRIAHHLNNQALCLLHIYISVHVNSFVKFARSNGKKPTTKIFVFKPEPVTAVLYHYHVILVGFINFKVAVATGNFIYLEVVR